MSHKANKKKKMEIQAPGVTHWKPPYVLYITALVCCVYFGLAIGSVYQADESVYDVFNKVLDIVSKNPLNGLNWHLILHQNITITGKSILLLLLIAGIVIMIDLTKNRDFMPGKEHGTAKWATPQEINRKYEAKKEGQEHWNRVYSQSLRISMDNKTTRINNNTLVLGGSGTGKSFFLLTPNVYNADPKSKYPGSYIFTDPKGELLQKNGMFLKSRGYRVKVLNLVPGKMQESDRFNPLAYIRSEEDIDTLIQNIFDNTQKPGASGSDPFWDNAAQILLKSLFMLVWMEAGTRYVQGRPKTMETVMWLLNQASVDDRGHSELDKYWSDIKLFHPLKENHPAWISFHKVMVGAADTIRSIIITANARMKVFENKELKRVLSGDDLDLASIGTGIVDGKKNVKTALFCVIPDSNKTFNCVAGMMYTLLFQELYYQADYIYRGELPVPVTFWLDEFANVALPENFINMLTTMRSRLISTVIILQNLAQIKAMYEKNWEEIPGNCDSLIYLGGNEQSTFEYISKNLGKRTIWKKSHGETKGSHGSSSQNEDIIGRELLLPEEVRELENDKLIIFIRGMHPVIDFKFKTDLTPEFKEACALGDYNHLAARTIDNDIHVSFATDEEIAAHSKDIINVTITNKDLESKISAELDAIFEENESFDKVNKKKVKKKKSILNFDQMTVEEILSLPNFQLPEECLEQVTGGIMDGLSDNEIKSYITLGSAAEMRRKRMVLVAFKSRKEMAVT